MTYNLCTLDFCVCWRVCVRVSVCDLYVSISLSLYLNVRSFLLSLRDCSKLAWSIKRIPVAAVGWAIKAVTLLVDDVRLGLLAPQLTSCALLVTDSIPFLRISCVPDRYFSIYDVDPEK